MQAVRLKLAGGKPKVVPPDEAQCVWKQRRGHPVGVQKVCRDCDHTRGQLKEDTQIHLSYPTMFESL